MTEIVKITDHVEAAKKRLISQYRGKPRIEGMLESFVSGHQDLENVFFDLYLKRTIDNGEGAQLDGVGGIVGQPRNGLPDELYRIQLYGKIGINTSEGTPEDLIFAAKVLTGANKATYTPYYPAECSIFVDVPPSNDTEELTDNDMEAAGVSAWTPVNDAILTKSTAAPHGGSQALRIAYNGTADPGASQDVLTTGRWYLLSGFVRMQNTAGKVPVIKNGSTVIYTGWPYADWYDFDVVFKATDSVITFGADFDAANWLEYDDASLRWLELDNSSRIFQVCQSVLPGGVLLNGMGTHDQEGAFCFEGDPDGEGFSSLDDPTTGGKFASLLGL